MSSVIIVLWRGHNFVSKPGRTVSRKEGNGERKKLDPASKERGGMKKKSLGELTERRGGIYTDQALASDICN